MDNIRLLHPKTENQRELFYSLEDNVVTLVDGFFGTGKANPDYTEVLTPNGYVRLDSLKIGDYVIDQKGKSTKILGVYPQGKKPIYEIEFKDGTFARSCDEHLWAVRTRKDRPFKVKPLKELITGINNRSPGSPFYYEIPLTEPVNFPHKELPLDPYTLGVLLGDGHFTKSGKVVLTCGKLDYDYFKGIYNEKITHQRLNNNVYQLSWSCDKDVIKSLGLYDKTKDLKFIPVDYLYADVEQRWALLQGLMDTGGSVSLIGDRFSFSNSNLNIVEGIVHLIQSLGGIATVSEYNKQGRTNYSVRIMIKNGRDLFRLPRKRNKVKNKNHKVRKLIKSVKYIGDQKSRCIMVDNEDHLFLLNDFIVTHNTLLALNYGLHLLSIGRIKKIVYTRPDVGTDFQRGRGYLPGTLEEKCKPLLAPILDNLQVLVKELEIAGVIDYIMNKNLIEYIYLEDLRGRSLNDCFFLLDEAQNLTTGQLKTALTRVGENTTIAIVGDSTQIDVREMLMLNGLSDAINKLRGEKNVGVIRFTQRDIVRNSAIKNLINKL